MPDLGEQMIPGGDNGGVDRAGTQPELPGDDDERATDPLTLLSTALDQTGAMIVGIRDDQQHMPTPCRSWDVSALVAHLVHDLKQIAELAVHGWDLAVATEQSTDLDPQVGDAALIWARTALRPQFRGTEDDGKAFGPEVDLPEEAQRYARLAGLFGHRAG